MSNKTKDMVRSILPSKWRKTARKKKAAIKRHGRRNAKKMLRTGDPDEFHLDELKGRDLGYDSMQGTVQERRYADKLAPMMRWAVRITKDMPQKERLDHMRSLLPSGVIGEHALEHLRMLEEFKNPDDLSYSWRYGSEREEELRRKELQRRRVLRRLRGFMLNGDHKLLNKIAKCVEVEPCKGLVDAADFHKRARTVYRWGEVEEEIDKGVPLSQIYSRVRKEQLDRDGWW